MRRFSQRNSLVTLNDINITPLLDLAFVLLIIFIITTPLLTQSLDLKLPTGGKSDKKPLSPRDIRTVEISRNGDYFLDRSQTNPEDIETKLVAAYKSNPNLIVHIRADQDTAYKYVAAIFDRCGRHDITRISLRTENVRR